eukprot:7518673-Heterocapsa_arctica.AAC.1
MACPAGDSTGTAACSQHSSCRTGGHPSACELGIDSRPDGPSGHGVCRWLRRTERRGVARARQPA